MQMNQSSVYIFTVASFSLFGRTAWENKTQATINRVISTFIEQLY